MTTPPDFDVFGHDEAWQLGSAIASDCRAQGLTVTISIHLGMQHVFHAALPGTSADNDDWVMRKTRIVQRFDRSSQEIGEFYAADDPSRFFEAFALARADFAPTGGAVPIRVHGTTVGVLSISGLTSAEDHECALDALRAASSRANRSERR